MSELVDVCILGSGPAGMAAAAMAAENGLSVALLDEKQSAGGQIFHAIETGPFKKGALFGADYAKGHSLAAALQIENVTRLLGVRVWRLDMTTNGGSAHYICSDRSSKLRFRHLVLATGAMERPVPFEGWTLPGVMNVGAAQLLLKASAAVPDGRIVLAGNGPLLLLFANQLLSQGVRILAILDTAPEQSPLVAASRHLASLFCNLGKVIKGLRMQARIRAAQIPVHRKVSDLRAVGEGCLQSISFRIDGQQEYQLQVDNLLIHEGIVPNTQVSRALGCSHVWDEGQQCLRPELDRYGESSIDDVFIVGDGAAIGGAIAAPASGQIAVGRILERRGVASAGSRAVVRKAETVLARERAFRPFLDELYPPRLATSHLSDETIACRCEAVPAGAVRAAIADGAIGPAQAKVFSRCGMGACQGRICGSITAGILADAMNRAVRAEDAPHVRFPLKPLSLAEMADRGSAFDEDNHHAA